MVTGGSMLFENEQINFDFTEQKSQTINDDAINKKYLDGEVRIVTEQARYPLDTIPMMIESGKYKLDPDFQRRHRWSEVKKSRLIESFIMNVPIPPIFLYENDFSYYEVMDGLQRLTTIYEFYRNKYSLKGLSLWSELNGRYYKDLPSKIRQGIDRRYISSIILLQESAKSEKKASEMKQLVFERINSGGVKLEPQETRNALYDGPMNRLCIQLSKNNVLCDFLNIPTVDNAEERDKNETYRKMNDVEYVLRFFAMRQLEGYSKRKLNDYLDYYLQEANAFDENLLKQLELLFKDTIQLAADLLGKKAFFMYRKRISSDGEISWNWYKKTTTTIYDPMMQVLSRQIQESNTAQLVEKKEYIRESIKDFYKDNYEMFEGRNNNKLDIEKRIAALTKFFDSFAE